jgi:hypothetical protein
MKLEPATGTGRAMDDELNHFLDSLPPRPPRSRLEPYGALIEELRRRGWAYRQIARVLSDSCQFQTSPSNIHYFVTRRESTAKPVRAAVVGEETSTGPAARGSAQQLNRSADSGRRIAAREDLEHLQQPAPTGFDFDASKPLRLLNRGKP